MNLPFRTSAARGAAAFYFREPGNFLLVRGTGGGGVVIRATADHFTRERQAAFIRYLCAEGFMAGEAGSLERFRPGVRDQEEKAVRWTVDPGWPTVDAAYALHVQRLCWCMVGTIMVWLAFMAILVVL